MKNFFATLLFVLVYGIGIFLTVKIGNLIKELGEGHVLAVIFTGVFAMTGIYIGLLYLLFPPKKKSLDEMFLDGDFHY
jgi:hypothetical protein